MSDIDYSICHKDHVPEYLSERWNKPRDLGSDYLLYRGQCEGTICSYESGHEVDDEGVPLKSNDDIAFDVMSLVKAGDPGPIVLCREHAQAAISLIQPPTDLV